MCFGSLNVASIWLRGLLHVHSSIIFFDFREKFMSLLSSSRFCCNTKDCVFQKCTWKVDLCFIGLLYSLLNILTFGVGFKDLFTYKAEITDRARASISAGPFHKCPQPGRAGCWHTVQAPVCGAEANTHAVPWCLSEFSSAQGRALGVSARLKTRPSDMGHRFLFCFVFQ